MGVCKGRSASFLSSIFTLLLVTCVGVCAERKERFAPLEELFLQAAEQLEDDLVRIWPLSLPNYEINTTYPFVPRKDFRRYKIVLEQVDLNNPEIVFKNDIDCDLYNTYRYWCICYEDLLGDDVNERYPPFPHDFSPLKINGHPCNPAYSGLCAQNYWGYAVFLDNSGSVVYAFKQFEHINASATFNITFATPETRKGNITMSFERRRQYRPDQKEYASENMTQPSNQTQLNGLIKGIDVGTPTQRRFFNILPGLFHGEDDRYIVDRPWCKTYWYIKNVRLAPPDREVHYEPLPNAVEEFPFTPYTRADFTSLLKQHENIAKLWWASSGAESQVKLMTVAIVIVSYFIF